MSELVAIVVAISEFSDAIVTGFATAVGAGIALVATWYMENRRSQAEEARLDRQFVRDERVLLVHRTHAVLDDINRFRGVILNLVTENDSDQYRLAAVLALNSLKVSTIKVGDQDLWNLYEQIRNKWLSQNPLEFDAWKQMVKELSSGVLNDFENRCRVLLHNPSEQFAQA